MQPISNRLHPILVSVVEQMLLDGSSPIQIVRAILDASLSNCESELLSLASEAIEKSDESSAESDRWLKESSDWRPTEAEMVTDIESYAENLTYHDEKINQLLIEQKSIEDRAIALVTVEIEALKMLDAFPIFTQSETVSTQATTDLIVERCLRGYSPYELDSNPDRHKHVLRFLVEIGRIGAMPKPPERELMLDIDELSELDDDIPF